MYMKHNITDIWQLQKTPGTCSTAFSAFYLWRVWQIQIILPQLQQSWGTQCWTFFNNVNKGLSEIYSFENHMIIYIHVQTDQFRKERMAISLTHWGRVTHICVRKLTIIGSDNGLSPGRRQAIIWTNAGILLIGPLGTMKLQSKFIHFHSRRSIWNCRLEDGGHLVSASMC